MNIPDYLILRRSGDLMTVYYPKLQAVEDVMLFSSIPKFTPRLLKDLIKTRRDIFYMGGRVKIDDTFHDVKSIALTSGFKGIFNLGGDLEYFHDCISNEDVDLREELLRGYGNACLESFFWTRDLSKEFGIRSFSMLQGKAMGGGAEAFLGKDITICDRGSDISTPEVLFGSFPGMGGIYFCQKRGGEDFMKDMVYRGRTFTGDELKNRNVIDYLVNEGDGRKKLYELFQLHRNGDLDFQDKFDNNYKRELISSVNKWYDVMLNLSNENIKNIKIKSRAQKIKFRDGREYLDLHFI